MKNTKKNWQKEVGVINAILMPMLTRQKDFGILMFPMKWGLQMASIQMNSDLPGNQLQDAIL